ncbi:hypothetical protein [Pseudomonas sp. 24 E 13]|nr:hypothetical protein [Pseudomonas sp. 24 E 13]CRM98716.1 hypothetical protein [Pseudomonas sp. 34 E 7]
MAAYQCGPETTAFPHVRGAAKRAGPEFLRPVFGLLQSNRDGQPGPGLYSWRNAVREPVCNAGGSLHRHLCAVIAPQGDGAHVGLRSLYRQHLDLGQHGLWREPAARLWRGCGAPLGKLFRLGRRAVERARVAAAPVRVAGHVPSAGLCLRAAARYAAAHVSGTACVDAGVDHFARRFFCATAHQ